MEPVASKVLDGLLEGLVLHAIEAEPSHGYGILKDLEGAIGEAPSKNRVYRILRDLEEADYVVSEEVTEDSRTRQVYSLTETGTDRLDEYRDLPGPFKTWLAGLFDVQGRGLASTESAPSRVESGWVAKRLDELPSQAPINARHASFSLDRVPGEGRWELTVERHEPADYEGADECALTYLYGAIQKLLFEQGPQQPGSG